MLIEIHDVIPMLVSISIILTVLYSFTLGQTTREKLAQSVSFAKPVRSYVTEPIQHWIARKVRRRESPEDDSDHTLPVSKPRFDEKRGGKPWENHLYSLSLNELAQC